MSWQTWGITAARVYYTVDGGPEQLLAQGVSGTAPASFVNVGHNYVFILRDYSTGTNGQELERSELSLGPPIRTFVMPRSFQFKPSVTSQLTTTLTGSKFMISDSVGLDHIVLQPPKVSTWFPKDLTTLTLDSFRIQSAGLQFGAAAQVAPDTTITFSGSFEFSFKGESLEKANPTVGLNILLKF